MGRAGRARKGRGCRPNPPPRGPAASGRDPVVPAQKQSSHGQNKDLEADASVNGDLAYD